MTRKPKLFVVLLVIVAMEQMMTTRALSAWQFKMIASALGALTLQGCFTLQAIEPVIDPPHQFKADIAVPVEFAAPGTIGFRCAERGATFLGLPGINSGACADTTLVTMIDPCMTITAGAYAEVLCDAVKLHRTEANVSAPVLPTRAGQQAPGLVKAAFTAPAKASDRMAPPVREISAWDNVVIEFVNPEDVEMRCAERGAKMTETHGAGMSCADRLMLTVANPCTASAQSWYTRTLCHEMAHANGWPADHPAYYQQIALKPASQSPQALALAARQGAEPRLTLAANDAPHFAAPAPRAMTPADVPAGMRQLVADFVSFGLSAGSQAPDALMARLKLAAWMLTPPRSSAKPAKNVAASRTDSVAPVAVNLDNSGTSDHRALPMRGRSQGWLRNSGSRAAAAHVAN